MPSTNRAPHTQTKLIFPSSHTTQTRTRKQIGSLELPSHRQHLSCFAPVSLARASWLSVCLLFVSLCVKSSQVKCRSPRDLPVALLTCFVELRQVSLAPTSMVFRRSRATTRHIRDCFKLIEGRSIWRDCVVVVVLLLARQDSTAAEL